MYSEENYLEFWNNHKEALAANSSLAEGLKKLNNNINHPIYFIGVLLTFIIALFGMVFLLKNVFHSYNSDFNLFTSFGSVAIIIGLEFYTFFKFKKVLTNKLEAKKNIIYHNFKKEILKPNNLNYILGYLIPKLKDDRGDFYIEYKAVSKFNVLNKFIESIPSKEIDNQSFNEFVLLNKDIIDNIEAVKSYLKKQEETRVYTEEAKKNMDAILKSQNINLEIQPKTNKEKYLDML